MARIELTREEFLDGIRKGLEDNTLSTPSHVAAFVVGFAAAHFVYEGQSLDEWLSLCHKSYEDARVRGIRLGHVSAPS